MESFDWFQRFEQILELLSQLDGELREHRYKDNYRSGPYIVEAITLLRLEAKEQGQLGCSELREAWLYEPEEGTDSIEGLEPIGAYQMETRLYQVEEVELHGYINRVEHGVSEEQNFRVRRGESAQGIEPSLNRAYPPSQSKGLE